MRRYPLNRSDGEWWMPYYAGFLTMLMFSFTIIKAWYTYRIPCIHFSFILKHSFLGSPNFLPRQMSTPMNVRGQQGVPQSGKMNQSYQSQTNQSFPGSPTQLMMPQSPYHQSMMSPAPFNQTSFVGNMTQQQRDPNYPMQGDFSAKHNGLYIYVGRILSPIWNLKCVSKSQAPENQEFVSISTVNLLNCRHYLFTVIIRFQCYSTTTTLSHWLFPCVRTETSLRYCGSDKDLVINNE